MTAQLVALGIREIEMSRGEFMLLSHPGEEMFRGARAMFDKAGDALRVLLCGDDS